MYSNNIDQDKVYISINGKGAWIECINLNAHDWCVYDAFEEETGEEPNRDNDFLVLDTDNESGLMQFFYNAEFQSFDFKKYAEFYDWLDCSNVDNDAVKAFIECTALEYCDRQKFEAAFIGDYSTHKDFLQAHYWEDLKDIQQSWLDYDGVWETYRHDHMETNDFYFYNI